MEDVIQILLGQLQLIAAFKHALQESNAVKYPDDQQKIL